MLLMFQMMDLDSDGRLDKNHISCNNNKVNADDALHDLIFHVSHMISQKLICYGIILGDADVPRGSYSFSFLLIFRMIGCRLLLESPMISRLGIHSVTGKIILASSPLSQFMGAFFTSILWVQFDHSPSGSLGPATGSRTFRPGAPWCHYTIDHWFICTIHSEG